MIELEMEERNKVGAAGKGLYSNVLAGRNVAETVKTMHISPGYAPIIDDMIFNNIGVTRTYKGDVMLYPKAFLDLYFRNGLNETKSGKQLLKG